LTVSLQSWRNHPAARYLPATLAILGIAAAPFALIALLGESTTSSVAPELVGIQAWVGAQPLTLAGLRGKVVLLDFWTYTCINCLRTIPYLNAWYDRYRADGLVVVGIHSPEFAFERDPARVEGEVRRLGVSYPVAIDSEKRTWAAYANQYWPHKYLIDRDGNIRHTQIGEGGYELMEAHIRELLGEHGQEVEDATASVSPEPVDAKAIATPEIYFGTYFGQFLGNPLGLRGMRGAAEYREPDALEPNLFYLSGRWAIGEEAVTSVGREAHRVSLRYTAKAVNVVAGAPGRRITVEVLRDGRPLGEGEWGEDIRRDEQGRTVVEVSDNRLYRLINDRAGYGTHTLTLVIGETGFEAYTLTFG
jgi:thiol-disulfide isomerase/thioredoxin